MLLNQRIKSMYILSNMEAVLWKNCCSYLVHSHSVLKGRAPAEVVYPVRVSQGIFSSCLEQETTLQHF